MVSILPFLIWESRGLIIVVGVGLMGWVLSLRELRARILVSLPSFFLLLTVYQVPLVLRALPGTGISKLGEVANALVESNDYSVKTWPVRTLQNLSLEFPDFACFYEGYVAGDNEVEALPIGYKVLAFSPTISLVDGWSQNYIDFQARANEYSPITAWAEMFLISPCIPYIVLTLFSVAVLSSLRKIAKFPVGRLIFSPGVGLLYVTTLTMASQYYTRTATHCMWVTCMIAAGMALVDKRLRLKRSTERAHAFAAPQFRNRCPGEPSRTP
jgi:hypothetical protein